MVEQLVALLQQDHSTSHEHVMGALLKQVDGHARSIQECQRPELKLNQLLRNKRKELAGKPEYQVLTILNINKALNLYK